MDSLKITVQRAAHFSTALKVGTLPSEANADHFATALKVGTMPCEADADHFTTALKVGTLPSEANADHFSTALKVGTLPSEANADHFTTALKVGTLHLENMASQANVSSSSVRPVASITSNNLSIHSSKNNKNFNYLSIHYSKEINLSSTCIDAAGQLPGCTEHTAARCRADADSSPTSFFSDKIISKNLTNFFHFSIQNKNQKKQFQT